MSVEIFEQDRRVLAGVAYRILGGAADAEDVVQEAWLRWSEVDAAQIEDPKAYLVRVTSRLAIDRLRRVKARREAYVGPWLPEPISTEPDLAEHVEPAEVNGGPGGRRDPGGQAGHGHLAGRGRRHRSDDLPHREPGEDRATRMVRYVQGRVTTQTTACGPRWAQAVCQEPRRSHPPARATPRWREPSWRTDSG
jgi:hypothetical protein